jgi:hypothetical protein
MRYEPGIQEEEIFRYEILTPPKKKTVRLKLTCTYISGESRHSLGQLQIIVALLMQYREYLDANPDDPTFDCVREGM